MLVWGGEAGGNPVGVASGEAFYLSSLIIFPVVGVVQCDGIVFLVPPTRKRDVFPCSVDGIMI